LTSTGFQKAKLNTEDVTDDTIVKGVIDKAGNTPEPITYSETETKRCLDVEVCNVDEISLSVEKTCYSSKQEMDLSFTTTPLTNTFATYYSYTGTGTFSGFAFRFDSTKTAVKLIIDGYVTLEVESDDLETSLSSSLDFLGLTWDSGKKIIQYYPRLPICFDTDVVIQARQTQGSRNLESIFVSIEKVS
jgi:hypothetical protein